MILIAASCALCSTRTAALVSACEVECDMRLALVAPKERTWQIPPKYDASASVRHSLLTGWKLMSVERRTHSASWAYEVCLVA